MVIDNLYIICKECKFKINIKDKESCNFKCPECEDIYYMSYHNIMIRLYDYRNGEIDINNKILHRSYVKW